MRNKCLIAAMALSLICPAVRAQDAVTETVSGTWINPHNSVKVKTGACGQNLCGWIVWASPKALSDAKESGVQSLIGTELLRNYQSSGAGKWHGTVYVPDKQQSYYSNIEALDANRLKISGCIMHGLICKSQIWRRD